MPNSSNITAPIILIAPPRSGTTLLQAAIEASGEVDCVGETIELLFGVWRCVQLTDGSYGIVRPPELPPGASFHDLAAKCVRDVYLERFPSPRPRWCTKLLGISRSLVLENFAPHAFADARHYWSTLKSTFPAARCFTILRNPCDVVLSTQRFSGYGQNEVWWSLGCVAHLLCHEDSPVTHAVSFDRLVEDPAGELRRLFEHLELPFTPQVLRVLDRLHAPAEDRAGRPRGDFSRRDNWPLLDPEAVNKRTIREILRLWDRFDVRFELPPQIRERFASAGTEPPDQPDDDDRQDLSGWTAEALRSKVLDQQTTMFQMSERFTRALTEQSQRSSEELRKRQQWIQEREETIAWWKAKYETASRWFEEERRRLSQELSGRGERMAALSRETGELREELARERARLGELEESTSKTFRQQQEWIRDREEALAWWKAQKEESCAWYESEIKRLSDECDRLRAEGADLAGAE